MFKRFIALLLISVMALCLTACNQTEERTEVPTTETTTESVPETKEPEPVDTIVISAGRISGQLCRAYADEEGDLTVSSLVAPTLYTYDRSGNLLLEASKGVTASYNGQDYTYTNWADVTSEYDAENDASTYTIKLNPNVRFSDGTEMTADDLIYSYYVYCDESYNGCFRLNDSTIMGIRGYQLNNSAAPLIDISDDDINDALSNPEEGLKEIIRSEIIRPTLEEEKQWCIDNWNGRDGYYVEKFDINSAEEFFVLLYTSSLQSDYNAEGKTFDQIVEDTVELFGMNYKTLARDYQNDLKYFDDKVERLTENYLFQTKLEAAGGEPVPSISGINKLDDTAISIRALGKGDALRERICNISVLSLNYYGDAALYNYEANAFGVTRGDVSVVKSKSNAPFGYGPYSVESAGNGMVKLVPNEYYYGEKSVANLAFVNVDEADKASALVNGELDITAIVPDDAANAELALSENELRRLSVNTDTYLYVGLNADELKINDSSVSPESLALRYAFATAFAQARNKAVLGLVDTGKVLEYPYSSSFWGTPKEGEEGFEAAFEVSLEGTVVNAENAPEMIGNYLARAGYKFGEDGKIVETPKGGKKEFEVLIPAYIAENTVLISILDEVISLFAGFGLTVSRTDISDINEFVLRLGSGGEDIWLAERSINSPKLAAFYSTGGSSNYYNLADAEIDELINKASAAADMNEKADLYKAIYKKIMKDAVEIPIYQEQQIIIYNADKLTVADGDSLTEFYGLADVLNKLVLVLAENNDQTPLSTTPEQNSADIMAEDTTLETTRTSSPYFSPESETVSESTSS